MFLPREKKILGVLFKKEKKFTTAQIAVELKVNPRTIKADIKKINDELEKHSCSIRTKRGVGLWLDYNPEGEAFLKTVLYEDQDSYISADIRKYYIAAKLLNSTDFISAEALANEFFVSKATVLNDLNDLKDFWEELGITFVKKVKYGIRAEGTERRIRHALFVVLGEVLAYLGGAGADNLQPLFEDVDLEQLKEMILSAEKRFQFVLTSISFDELLIQIAVILQRTVVNRSVTSGRQAHLADGGQSDTQFTPYAEESNLTDEGRRPYRSPDRDRKEWFICQYFKEQIGTYMNMRFPETEIPGLITCLKGLRFQVPMARAGDRETARSRNPRLFDYMMQVLMEIDSKYSLSLAKDEEFICAMFTHLVCMFYRIQSRMCLANPILESVKKEMFYEYEMASYMIDKFKSKYGIEATDDEIGYITFHIGASIERMAQLKKKRLTVTIVCTTGLGTSQFISIKLKRLFPDLVIQKIISDKETRDLKKEEQDFVISTVPLSLEGIHVVQVSLVLNEEDTKCIRKYVEERGADVQDKENETYDCLKNYLHDEITILTCDLKSREEAIQLLGNRMAGEGFVDAGYVESVFKREKLSDTSMGSLIAIPHAFEGHILKQGIGFMTLKKPIVWGKHKVQMVFMLALNTDTGIEEFQKIFKAIFRLTRNFKDIDKILKMTSLEKLKDQCL